MTRTLNDVPRASFALAATLVVALACVLAMGVSATSAYAFADTGLAAQADPLEPAPTPQDISTATVTPSATSFVFTGAEQKPAVTVTLGSVTLVQDTDYTVAYANNTNVGTATVTVTGMGDYTGTASANFTITAASLASAKVTAAAAVYSGSALTPTPTVTLGGATLKAGADFTATYSANVKVGTATVKVTGSGNYAGTATGTFKITAKPLDAAKVKAAAKVYTGKALTPAVKVTLSGKTLKKGADYTVSYRNAAGKAIKATSLKKAATYTIVVKGMGNYKAKATGKFVIKPKSLSKAKLTTKNKVYTGEVIVPPLKVKMGKTKLKLNRDYTVKYLNSAGKRVKGSKLKAAGWYKIVVTGKGNYKGTKKVKFGLTRRPITKAKVTVKNKVYTGKAITPTPKVMLGDRKLKMGRDFTVKYAHNVKAGTATVKVKGMGNYKGSAKGTFTIKRKSIADAVMSGVKNKTYTGEPIIQDVVVKLDGKKLVKDRDYEVVYRDNTDVGTAVVGAKGKGNYKGTIKRTFEIKQRSIKNAEVSGIESRTYNGSKLRQENMTIVVDGNELELGKDYKVMYTSNRTVGTAKMTIKAEGNYKGTLKREFEITAANIADADVDSIASKTYTGRSLTPIPYVTYNGKRLLAGSDYVREYHNNIMPGRATIVLTGRGNFTGQKVVYFNIVKRTVRTSSSQSR